MLEGLKFVLMPTQLLRLQFAAEIERKIDQHSMNHVPLHSVVSSVVARCGVAGPSLAASCQADLLMN